MSDSSNRPPILHIHGQRYPQDAIEIFGTRAGLESLVNALIEALEVGRGGFEFVVDDGFEGRARIVRLDGARRDEEWRRSGSPYLDVDDPLVARIIDLTEENARLRQTVDLLRLARQSGPRVDYRQGPTGPDKDLLTG